MGPKEYISHEGIVTNCLGDQAVIHLLSPNDCHSCHFKEFCGVEDDERTRFVVPNEGLEIGQSVAVEISSGNGLKAAFMAYVLPFLLMIMVLAMGELLNWSEAISGALSLAILLPYYLILFRFKAALRAVFDLKIKHQ